MPAETAQERLQNLSANLQRLIFKLKPVVSSGPVHHLRTTARRIESYLKFAGPDLSRRHEASLEKMAALRRRAGKVRDFDVQIELLKEIANGSTAADRRVLADHLSAKRQRQAERLSREARKLRQSKFFGHLEEISQAVTRSTPEKHPLEEAQAQLAALGRRITEVQKIKPRQLHALRTKLKMTRYLAEAGPESEEQRTFLTAVKAVQDAIGGWHDWEQLSRSAEKKFHERANCPLVEEIRGLCAAKFAAALSSADRLLLNSAKKESRKPPKSASPRLAFAHRAG